jgi:hypothetical protein
MEGVHDVHPTHDRQKKRTLTADIAAALPERHWHHHGHDADSITLPT